MFRACALVIGASALLASPLASAHGPKRDAPHKSPIAAAVAKVKPALVFIEERKDKGAEQGKRPASALGVLIDPKGTVVTNHSAIRAMKKREVILSDGRRLPAKALLSDPHLDLAILKVEDARPLPAVEVEDSDKLKVGDWVIALSALETTALDEPLMVTVGLVGGKVRGTKEREFLFLVETSIGPRCNPGLLITMDAKLVGVVVSRDVSQHSSAAVPSNHVKERVTEGTKGK